MDAPFRKFEAFNCAICDKPCIWVGLESRPDDFCLEHRKNKNPV